MPELVNVATPDSAKTRTVYELVSDKFKVENCTSYLTDDLYWEAIDLWYGATNDLDWYDRS
jgi:beta-glucan synthesis-associated protein KRE6